MSQRNVDRRKNLNQHGHSSSMSTNDKVYIQRKQSHLFVDDGNESWISTQL